MRRIVLALVSVIALVAVVFLIYFGLVEEDFVYLLERAAELESTDLLADTDIERLNKQLAEEPNDWLANYMMQDHLMNDSPYSTVRNEKYIKAARKNFPWDRLRTEDPNELFQYRNDVQTGMVYLYAARFLEDEGETDMAKQLAVSAIQKLSSCTIRLEAIYDYFDMTLYEADSVMEWARQEQDERFYDAVIPVLESCSTIEFKEIPEYAMVFDALYRDAYVCLGYHALHEGLSEEALAAADHLKAVCNSREDFEYLMFYRGIRTEAYVRSGDAEAAEAELKAYIELAENYVKDLQKDPIAEMMLGDPDARYWRSLGSGREMYELAEEIGKTDLTDHWYGADGSWQDLLEVRS